MNSIKSIIEGESKFLCEHMMKTVSADFCFKKCVNECNVPRGIRIALIRSNMNYKEYFERNNGIIHFRIHSLMGNVCVKKLILEILKPLKSYPSIDFLNKTEKGKALHYMFRQGYEMHSIHLMYEEEIEGMKFAIHGEVDYYDTFGKQIVDLKTTEWMPSFRNKNGKDRDIEQVRLYDGLNQKGRVVGYYDENDILHSEMSDIEIGTKLDVDILRLVYYNTAQTNPKGTLGDFFEVYDVERNLDLFEQKLFIIRECIRYVSDFRKTGVPKSPKVKCRNKRCDYKDVICK